MGSTIRIHSLHLKTAENEAKYTFDSSVTVITGSVGVGKSSLLELIKFALGGSAKLMPAIAENVTSVEVEATLGESRLRFHRDLDSKLVDVIDSATGEIIGPWAVTNRKYVPLASQQLLSRLSLPMNLRIPKSRVKPTSDTVAVSFFDLYRYVYLGQNEIDTSVVGHTDRNLDNKRRAVFELLYGLNSPELIDLAIQKGELNDREKELRSSAQAVKDFLEQAREPSPEELPGLREAASEELSAVRAQLEQLRSDSSVLIESQRGLRTRVSDLRATLIEVEAARDAAAADVHKSESLVAQLKLDAQALARTEVAHRALSGLEFSICPRCMQSVQNRDVPVNHCMLCLQPEELISETDSDESKRLISQIKETEELLQEDRNLLDAYNAQKRDLQQLLADSSMELERGTSELITPRLEQVQFLAMAVARLEGRMEFLEASAARWSNYFSTLESADEAKEAANQVGVKEASLQAALSANQSRIGELSEIFDSIVSGFNLPWYQSAEVDQKTYLPVVNGQEFDQLSVGGARKTLVNLAYHLAGLQYAVTHDSVSFPTLLIADSPRKNIGQTDEDARMGSAIYRRFSELQQGESGQFQLIVADNNIPSDFDGQFAQIHLTYDDPLVPGVTHPGEGVETIG
ncbi:AAA family ATPase [Streptomyces griseorubiginosus]|uniref:AAA family ATPase n=1 Tax=Streptomyces griseorubiginosus TaxID=67304 RepID=UPI0036395C70